MKYRKEVVWVVAMIVAFVFAENTRTTPFTKPKNQQPDSLLQDSISVLDIQTVGYKKKVHASYYADKFNGRKTASGQRFSNQKLTAAHRSLPFGTQLKVTNPINQKSVIVTITDRGPFSRGREIDLSKRAFKAISHQAGRGFLLVNLEKVK